MRAALEGMHLIPTNSVPSKSTLQEIQTSRFSFLIVIVYRAFFSWLCAMTTIHRAMRPRRRPRKRRRIPWTGLRRRRRVSRPAAEALYRFRTMPGVDVLPSSVGGCMAVFVDRSVPSLSSLQNPVTRYESPYGTAVRQNSGRCWQVRPS